LHEILQKLLPILDEVSVDALKLVRKQWHAEYSTPIIFLAIVSLYEHLFRIVK